MRYNKQMKVTTGKKLRSGRKNRSVDDLEAF